MNRPLFAEDPKVRMLGYREEELWKAISGRAACACCAPKTLNEWAKKVEVDTGQCGCITTEMAEKKKALERESRALKWANEILRKAFAYLPRRSLTARSRHDPLRQRSPR